MEKGRDHPTGPKTFLRSGRGAVKLSRLTKYSGWVRGALPREEVLIPAGQKAAAFAQDPSGAGRNLCFAPPVQPQASPAEMLSGAKVWE